MRGKVAKRMRKQAKLAAGHAENVRAVDHYGLRTVVTQITRHMKRRLKRAMKFNIDSINRQTMMSRTDAVTRTKKIVWSFGTRDQRGRLRGRGTATVIGTQVGRHIVGTGRKGRYSL